MKISNWIKCNIFKFHDWTTDLEQRGGKIMDGLDTPEKIKASFINDCKMYCRYCGHQSELNKRLDNF